MGSISKVAAAAILLAWAAVATARGAAGSAPASPESPHRAVSPTSPAGLLCTLARQVPTAAGGAFASAREGCGCGEPTPGCRVVDLANDRRMSLALSPGTRHRVALDAGPGDRLRFSVGVAATAPARIGIAVRLRDGGDAVVREWQREIVRWGGWVDAEIDLAGLPPGGVRSLEVDVSAGPVAPPGASVALAVPRLVNGRTGSSSAAAATPAAGREEASSGERAAAPVVPRNVVLYVIDTLRADRTSPYGCERDTTPHLDRLAREGTTFERAYSVGSWTRPAIASLFTGLRPASHRVGVDRGLGSWPPTLAERFRAAGWSTRAFVANVQLTPPSLGFDRGFERFLAFPGGDGGLLARTSEMNPSLLRELENSRGERLFLYVHAVDPHAPYDPPDGYEGLFGDPGYDGSITGPDVFRASLASRTMSPADVARVRDLYDEDVRFQDEMLGTLLDRLAATGLDRDTLVVVVSDHGEELGDHGDWEHGERAWEELIRVPLVVRWPGRPELAGRRVSDPVQIVDLLPTLLATTGLPAAPEARGRDLLALAAAAPPRGPAAGIRGVPSVPVLTTELGDGWDLIAIERDGWKLVRRRPHEGPAEDRLFHLPSDPRERRDRSASNRGRVADLARELEGLVREDEALAAAASSGTPADIPADTRRRLEELGYLEP